MEKQPKRLRKPEFFSFYESAAMERHLEKMAAKGWRLSKLGSVFWTFEAMEPKKLHYSVVYYPKATAFDPGPSPQQQELWELCRQEGWKLAASNAQLQIFYNEAEKPLPIETEPQLQLENLHRAMKRSLIPSYCLLFVLGLLQVGLSLSRLSQDFVGSLSDGGTLLALGGFLLVQLTVLLELGQYFLWRRKALAVAREEGRFLPMKGRGGLQIGLLLVLGLLMLGWLWSAFRSGRNGFALALGSLGLVLVLVAAERGLLALLRRKGVSKGLSMGLFAAGCVLLTLLLTGGVLAWALRGGSSGADALIYEYKGHSLRAYEDELSPSLEDLGLAPEGVPYSRRLQVQDSLLLRLEEGHQEPYLGYPEAPSLAYSWVKPGLRALYEPSLRHWMEEGRQGGFSYIPLEPAPWGAEAAWQLSRDDEVPGNQYLLCYGDSFLELKIYGEVPAEELLALELDFAN